MRRRRDSILTWGGLAVCISMLVVPETLRRLS